MRKLVWIAALMVVSAGVVACTPNISPDSYSVASVGQVNRVVKGFIVSVREVKIEGTQTGIGAGSGAVTGAIAGHAVGNDGGMVAIATLGGAVIGGLAGAATEQSLTQQMGYEYVVETDNGALLTIVQGGTKQNKGQRVLVIYGTKSRLSPLE
jgi:outer membrane lipoprotein SlyB